MTPNHTYQTVHTLVRNCQITTLEENHTFEISPNSLTFTVFDAANASIYRKAKEQRENTIYNSERKRMSLSSTRNKTSQSVKQKQSDKQNI